MNGLGWKKKKILSGIVFMAPEVWLFDLSDPFKVMENGGVRDNLALYRTFENFCVNFQIKPVIDKILSQKKFAGLDVFVLKGQSLETEVRLVGTDNRIHNFKKIFINFLKSSEGFAGEINKIESVYGKKYRPLHKIKKPLTTSSIKKYHSIIDYYKFIDKDFEFPDNIYGIFKLIPDIDYIVLVPQSGFKFLDEISKKFGFKKISFFERHFSREGNFWLFKKDFRNKRVLIIDVSYSGETLNSLAETIHREGGTPLKMAVWPKSRLGVSNSEYIVFLDKVIKMEGVLLEGNEPLVKLYEKIAFNKF